AAYGFNESFAGEEGLENFKKRLGVFVDNLKGKAFNGTTAPQIVLVAPISNEDVPAVAAAKRNNGNIALYVQAMHDVAAEKGVGIADAFDATQRAMSSPGDDLTVNGVHLNEQGYQLFAKELFQEVFQAEAPEVNERLRQEVIDKNRQYFRRYRPANTFYYTGNRNKSYGYLDFLPAMRNFDLMVGNREERIQKLAIGAPVEPDVDDSNLPLLPKTKQSRGANRWLSAEDELKDFEIDPRFEVNLFAGEEQFPELGAPIQMRWDGQGRLWVSCSTTYPHVYPGNEPDDKLVILEDTDGDGRADKSTVFADDLHIPLSFEFGDGGVYVSEMPDLTFLKDTDGDGKADLRKRLLTGFGTEDSHHALHDFVWSPDGDLIFRESIFHHSQVETAYGPIRQQNSGWFRFEPEIQKLTSFGTYHSTNPWGVTFDDWGQHVASHPIYAAAFHSLDPPYPTQHPKPDGLRAYSGTCGQEFVDFGTFPDELQGHYIKARYKPTNRIEIHKWTENEFGFDEEYQSDLIFSKNLSFIPVDIGYGPRGAMYVCDWYNPIKGHAQYSLRDERRDRHSGRIWRITAKGKPLQDPAKIEDAATAELLDLLKRPEYRIRYWAKRELRERDPQVVKKALDKWVKELEGSDPRLDHHRLEAIWAYRGIGAKNLGLLRQLLQSTDHMARAAATEQLRYWHAEYTDALSLLRASANDPSSIVRMQAAIASSYIGTKAALDVALDIYKHPLGGHLEYALTCALGSENLRRHWENNSAYDIAKRIRDSKRKSTLEEPPANAIDAQFDSQKNLKTVRIGCIPERMKFTVEEIRVKPGQPTKIVFSNGDATDHNLLIVQPGALENVGMAANEMARDPKNANSNFIPPGKKNLIIQAAPMIGPTRKTQVHVMRFKAPEESGVYPYVCTFPGHWVIMSGNLIVARNDEQAAQLVESTRPSVVREWKLSDLVDLETSDDELALMRGLAAFKKAKCEQCHQMGKQGLNLGPDLSDVRKRFRGDRLLEQMLSPSKEIADKYRSYRFLLDSGQVVAGVIQEENDKEVKVITNLLNPKSISTLTKKEIELRSQSRVSSMPEGLLNVLTKQEIADLLSLLQSEKKVHDH
ncbi:MAG: PVC-type heme-binding CxxCH protein, partial [Planctomycetota bacterium]